MNQNPEQKARDRIDKQLEKSGWHVCDYDNANIHAHRGVVLRHFQLKPGHGEADYLFYVDGKAAGVIEAKKIGSTLTGVEIQSNKYKNGLPESLPAWHRPLPFAYESTGEETQFTNGLDPAPRSRNVFSFHRPETLAGWLADIDTVQLGQVADKKEQYGIPETLRFKLQHLPPLNEEGLWHAQVKAIKNLKYHLPRTAPVPLSRWLPEVERLLPQSILSIG